MSRSDAVPRRPRRPGPLVVVAAGIVVAALAVVGLARVAGTGTPEDTTRRPRPIPTGAPTAAPALLAPVGSPAPAQSERPNIVLLLTDDMRADDMRWMPSVRRLLGGRGLTFRNSFSPYPLCCPARASLLSGQYAHNHRVFSHIDPFGFGAFDDRATLGTSLNRAGYNTIFLGKYLNGYGVQDSLVTGEPSFRYVPPGWTDWYAAVSRPRGSGFASGGTYTYFNTLFNINGRIDDSHRGEYQTDVLGSMARELLRKYHRSAKPFFLHLSPVAPHFGSPRERDDPTGIVDPSDGGLERIKTPARPVWVRGRFDDRIPVASGLPLDGGPSEADVSDKPRPIDGRLELTEQEREAVRTLTRQRAESLYVLDREVARIVSTLKATDEYDNTVFVFTSDNGYFLGEHRMRQGKIKPHEPSLRVPFVIAGPGIPRGVRYDPVTTPDVSATILDLAGARPPRPLDGRSLVGSFEADRGWTTPVVTEGLETAGVFRRARRDPAPGFDDPRTTIGVRTARWKLVRYIDGDGELYDLDRDPNELENRFDDPRLAGVQRRLARLWTAREGCAGPTCRAPLPPALRRAPAPLRTATERQSDLVEQRYGYRW